jgi:hypothetical protein
MRVQNVMATVGSLLLAAAGSVAAQTPLASSTRSAVDAVVGNQVLQVRYLGDSPFAGIGSNLDYGVLLF